MHTKISSSQHVCLWCLKPLYHDSTLFDLFIPLSMLCHSCSSKINKKHLVYSIEQLQCESMVVYDKDIEHILFRYKEDGDLPLAPSFFYQSRHYLRKHKDFVFVLMPSSEEKTKERGFWALEKMISPYVDNYKTPLIKTKNVKQSQQSLKKRKEISKSMIITDVSIIKNKKVILVDDVCTTGSTLLSGYKLIAPHAQSVKAFTFAASSMLFQKQ